VTQPFLETPRFPDDLSIWGRGGVNYATTVVTSTSGRETRNSMWTYGRGRWDMQNVQRMTANNLNYNIATLRNFFRVCKGRAYGFRFRDWTDSTDDGNGVLGTTGYGTGVPTYQLYKNYVLSPLTDQRLIAKPMPGTVSVLRNSVIPPGSGPGSYTLDTTTGLVTFVADNYAFVSAWTPGASTQFTVASVPAGWAVGKYLYCTAVGGTGAALVNNVALQITGLSGTTITLGVATTGLTLNNGQANFYPQASDALTWTGSFDTPVRFDTDAFEPQMGPDGLYTFQSLPIVEIRV
jgi:uncharacterized protein (TIGR02217 family)